MSIAAFISGEVGPGVTIPTFIVRGLTVGAAAAALTGTITTATEADIVSGGRTIVLTLTNDTWVATGATFDAQRQNIIDGLTSAGTDPSGWNGQVRDAEVVTAVVRTSDTVVTVTLSAAAGYDISANETITATIPATALSGGSPVVASPTFTVTYVEETADAANTGGWLSAYERYRDEGEVRRERIARGIIPDDMPAEVVKAAAATNVEVLAKRKLRQLAAESDQLERLEAVTMQLMAAQKEAAEEAYNALLAELRESEAVYSQMSRNRNAQAVLVMLGLL